MLDHKFIGLTKWIEEIKGDELLYMLSCHNEQYRTYLPLYIRFFDTKRHDSVSGIVALAEFRKINLALQIKNMCPDFVHDNYITYELCQKWNIAPFIDLNSNRGLESIPKRINIDTDGNPLCVVDFRMIYQGYGPKRHDCKWHCLYTKPDWDIRLYTPALSGTEEFKNIKHFFIMVFKNIF